VIFIWLETLLFGYSIVGLLVLVGVVVKARNKRAFLTQILDENPVLKTGSNGFRSRAVNNVAQSARATIPQVDDSFLVQTTRDNRAIGQNSNVRGESVAKARRAANGLVRMRPLEANVPVNINAPLDMNAFGPITHRERGLKSPADFLDHLII
jgi:hypothetical protein